MPKKTNKKVKKKQVIKDFRKSDKDSGSAQVQIGLLTREIKDLAEHLRKHIHDFSSRRGLLKKVSKRRKLLKYLQIHNPKSYERIIKKIKK